MKLARQCIILLLMTFSMSVQAEQRTSFDTEWKFALGDHAGAETQRFDDASWRGLDVPHDWSIEGEYRKDHPMGDQCGYLPAGIGWYRKTIPVPGDWKGKHVEIAFDGVFMNSTVWCERPEARDTAVWMEFIFVRHQRHR